LFVTFDHNNWIFLTAVWFDGDGLWKTDNINKMITLTKITLSSFHCIRQCFSTFFSMLNFKGKKKFCREPIHKYKKTCKLFKKWHEILNRVKNCQDQLSKLFRHAYLMLVCVGCWYQDDNNCQLIEIQSLPWYQTFKTNA
jgi:hypothetical protein